MVGPGFAPAARSARPGQMLENIVTLGCSTACISRNADSRSSIESAFVRSGKSSGARSRALTSMWRHRTTPGMLSRPPSLAPIESTPTGRVRAASEIVCHVRSGVPLVGGYGALAQMISAAPVASGAVFSNDIIGKRAGAEAPARFYPFILPLPKSFLVGRLAAFP